MPIMAPRTNHTLPLAWGCPAASAAHRAAAPAHAPHLPVALRAHTHTRTRELGTAPRAARGRVGPPTHSRARAVINSGVRPAVAVHPYRARARTPPTCAPARHTAARRPHSARAPALAPGPAPLALALAPFPACMHGAASPALVAASSGPHLQMLPARDSNPPRRPVVSPCSAIPPAAPTLARTAPLHMHVGDGPSFGWWPPGVPQPACASSARVPRWTTTAPASILDTVQIRRRG